MTKSTTIEKAVKEGKYDAEHGLPFALCPYTQIGSPERRAWQDAWQAYHFVIGRRLKKTGKL